MTWTYDTTLSTDLAKVRLTIGDTNTNNQELTDEAIEYFLDENPSIRLASISCLDALIAKHAQDVDRSNLGMSASRSQKIQHWIDLRASLQAKVDSVAGVFFGGGSLSEKDTVVDDSDFPQHAFTRGRDDNA